ncbi:hypothetical protein ACTWJ9_33240 (plasmid) [Streptomyces sp. GDS52]|uniref:hypothetical protein n=1 Tax=Streptomyces sp. GDS52 TaxID=3406419 RepID=UPI003FD09126
MATALSPLDALYAELIPSRPESAPSSGPWTVAEQDAHWARLCEAVGTPGASRPVAHPSTA